MAKRKRRNNSFDWRKILSPLLKGGLLVAIVLAVLGGIIYVAVFKNPVFNVKKVLSNQPLPPGMRSSFYGINIFFISLRSIYVKLRDIYPYAKDIRVLKRLPSTIEITVQRRHPVLFTRRNGVIYPIDEDGVVLEANASLPREILEVYLPRDVEIREGEAIKSESLYLALDLLSALKKLGLLDVFEFDYIDAIQPFELRLRIKNGPLWKFRGGHYEEKLSVFKKRLMSSFLDELPHLTKNSYLLFLEDGTITFNP